MDRGIREDEDLRLDPGQQPGQAVAASPSSHAQSHRDLPTHPSPSPSASPAPVPAQSTQQPQHQYYNYVPCDSLQALHAAADDYDPFCSAHDDHPRPPLLPSPFAPAPVPVPVPATASSYATNSFHAAASNATVVAPRGSPDDFYRGFDVEIAKHALVTTPAQDPMASAASTNRPAPPAASSSSNNTTTTTSGSGSNGPLFSTTSSSSAKPHAIAGSRPSPRSFYRSASNPVDDRSFTNEGVRLRSATGSAVPSVTSGSVRDMKKRFEQNGTPAAPEARRTPSRGASRAGGPAKPPYGRSATYGEGSSYASLRANTTDSSRSTAHASTGSQRSRFVPEDQVSTNSQSFASRINRPKATSTSNLHSTRSAPSANKQSSSSTSTPAEPLLFGEIRHEDANTETPGFGIDEDPLLQTEQDQNNPSAALQEPASPTDWYRGASVSQKKGPPKTEPSPPKSHSRSRSDLAASKLPSLNTNNSQVRRRIEQSPSPRPSGSSRLPVTNNKFNTPSSATSPASTRSNSPASARRTTSNGRTSRQQNIPLASSSKAPAARSKTPTSSTAARKTPVPSSNSGSRLAAVISPPLKLSPPLRSSRPRQPVSQATTASSRLKTVDRSKSPTKTGLRPSARPESRQDAPPTRRRKLSLGGPVDFAQRRETIKLKYSKTIRDTEARQAREAAAEKRKKELEAAAKAKARAQARAEAQVAAAEAEAAAAAVHDANREQARPFAESRRLDSPKEDITQTLDSKVMTMTIEDEPVTTEKTPLPVDHKEVSNDGPAHPSALGLDSPTLGLPGTFPNLVSPPFDENEQEEAPPSAVSETSVITEFDNETQTEPPRPEKSVSTAIIEPVQTFVKAEDNTEVDVDVEDEAPVTLLPSTTYKRATYRDPFEDIPDEGSIPIAISFEPSAFELNSEAHSQNTGPESRSLASGAFAEGYDMELVSRPSHHHILEQEQQDPHAHAEEDSLFQQPSHNQHHHHHRRRHQHVEPAHEPASEQDVESVHELEYEASVHSEVAAAHRHEVEYEPPPYVAQPYHTTTVTIISRDVGFGFPPYVDQEETARLRSHNEQQLDQIEDYYTGPRIKDNMSSLRDSTYTASDMDASDGPSGYGEAQRTPDTSNSLNIPSMTTPANRSSQQSIWTDLSYSSRDSRRIECIDQNEIDGSRPQSLRDDDSLYRHRYYMHGAADSETLAEPNAYRQPPQIDESSQVASLPPEHSPPPPPEAESRPTSEFYDHTPDSSAVKDEDGTISFPMSRRDSDDYHETSSPQSFESGVPVPTPQESDHKTSEDVDDSEPAKKEIHRLRQRQLVIQELVDTEAVFVRDMNVVEEIYKGTAEACPKLDDKTIKLIFRNTHEIVAFHTNFLGELKDGVTSVYVPRGRRSPLLKDDTSTWEANTLRSNASIVTSIAPSIAPSSTTAVSLSGVTITNDETDDAKDRQTIIGPAFVRNIELMRAAHEGFLRTSDVANKRLIDIQQDPGVQVWLNECNEVARDLTAAWNLDSLLIKPMQRITKYPNLIAQLLQYTPESHPDREGLVAARASVETAILEINKTKKNFELVGQIVGRKGKDTDVKAGFARAFGKRVDKLQASANRVAEDSEYLKLNEKFSDDYLRLQVVLRDVEFYTRHVADYVQTFLDYLSAMELVMRLQPGPYPELEAKWVQFNVSMRDIKTVALDQHLSAIRKHVIEPFEMVIRSYQNPLLAMKKRNKRRLDYEKSIQLKKSGKKVDKQLSELVEHYEALNDTLKKELPQLSALTEKVGNICLGNMINISAKWWNIWKDKIRAVTSITEPSDVKDIVITFQRDFKEMEEQVMSLGILNSLTRSRTSQSTADESLSRIKSRPSDPGTPRIRGLSMASDQIPSLPTPEFARQHTQPYPTSPPPPNNGGSSSASYYYRDYYAGLGSRGPSSPVSDMSSAPRSVPPITTRPGTGRSYDSTGMPRPSIDSLSASYLKRESSSATSPPLSNSDGHRNSGLFQSALPLNEAAEDYHPPSSRASSRERHVSNGYNILWLAASLFEFNIETTKHEAGYPYLTYTAGEIFDVIAEKGELWLAKNQDDPQDLVGWIWSKHFAKLADS
ncbi:hypothetical protein BD289DRAFT_481689 [Coniella lustricola]|uniref:DH domain-containing protein n=1 Tax=Coniella lustricola TaxID=2025994 RepID=A0A2T3ABG2_9PEZI|nr:hypothetical protein BD289DRAFT_481689 [Coniella lustricola]